MLAIDVCNCCRCCVVAGLGASAVVVAISTTHAARKMSSSVVVNGNSGISSSSHQAPANSWNSTVQTSTILRQDDKLTTSSAVAERPRDASCSLNISQSDLKSLDR